MLLLSLTVTTVVPSVHGQLTCSNPNLPCEILAQVKVDSTSKAALQSDGTASFTVTVDVTFPWPAIIPGLNYLLFGVVYYATTFTPQNDQNWKYVNGTATSSPDSCMTGMIKPQYSEQAICVVSSTVDTERVTFNLKIFDAGKGQQYQFTAMVMQDRPSDPYVAGSANFNVIVTD